MKEESTFLKKRSKKPHSVASEAWQSIFVAQQQDGLLRQEARNAARFFCFFLFKKRRLYSLTYSASAAMMRERRPPLDSRSSTRKTAGVV